MLKYQALPRRNYIQESVIKAGDDYIRRKSVATKIANALHENHKNKT